MDALLIWVGFASNVATLLASAIAIYLFFWKKDAVLSAFHVLMNYAYQISLSEIKEKIERLNEYNARNPEDKERIINIIHEIVGQIRGNDKLRKELALTTDKLEDLASHRGYLTEPKKRSLVSELRERVRNLNVKSIDEFLGDNGE